MSILIIAAKAGPLRGIAKNSGFRRNDKKRKYRKLPVQVKSARAHLFAPEGFEVAQDLVHTVEAGILQASGGEALFVLLVETDDRIIELAAFVGQFHAD